MYYTFQIKQSFEYILTLLKMSHLLKEKINDVDGIFLRVSL